MAQVVTLLTCIQDVPGLDLGQGSEVPHGSPLSIQANTRTES